VKTASSTAAGGVGSAFPSAAGELGGAVLALIGLTCAVCVANNYYSQPLLIDIARDLGMPRSLSGLVPTLTQIGIAIGMVFLLPLGDRIDNRKIVVLLLMVQSFAMATMAATADRMPFMVACMVAGLCGIVTYLLPAYATRLVPAERRGAVTGTLATGILTGIMLGRSIAGIAGYEVGWRAVYAVAAVVTFIMAVAMKRSMPLTPGLREESYSVLLGSLWTLLQENRLLRRTTLMQAMAFGGFNALWVGLTLHLQQPPFGLDTRAIGTLALFAVTSAMAAPFLGRLADRMPMERAVRISFAIAALGWVALLTLPGSYVGIIAGMVLVGISAIGTDVTLRTALYGLSPDIRMRLNAVYSAGTFIGGGALSFLTPFIWAHLGWGAVAITGLTISVLPMLIPNMRPDEFSKAD
jgi:predicted MFS family arabinose efflux permease